MADNRKIHWEMLLSHHAPCDYDRTWRLGSLRICTRCTGMLLGFIAGLGSTFFLPQIGVWQTAFLCMFLMLPAGFDFACHELFKAYRSHDSIRFCTGVIFGWPIGLLLRLCFYYGVVMPFVTILIFAAVMQVVIGFVFLFRGHLEGYLAKYELAVFGEELSAHHHDCCCDHD